MRVVVQRLRGTLEKLFGRHLLLTNLTLGCWFMASADAVQQNIEKKLKKKSSDYDVQRTASMSAGGVVFGILGHGWYWMLDRKFPGRKVKTVAKKLMAEMAIGPPLILAVFLGVGFLEGRTVKQSIVQFKENFILICVADWAFYAPLQGLNFYFLPPRYRFLYTSTITFIYDVFLSYIIHEGSNTQIKSSVQTGQDTEKDIKLEQT